MSLFRSKALANLKADVAFFKAAQKLTAQNIARSNTPGAKPLKLEKTSPQNHLQLAQPAQGKGFLSTSSEFNRYLAIEDTEAETEAASGESHISIENESIRMAELDDQHHLALKTLNGWKKGIRIVTGNSGG